jgi:hypothetical protein
LKAEGVDYSVTALPYFLYDHLAKSTCRPTGYAEISEGVTGCHGFEAQIAGWQAAGYRLRQGG